MLFIQVILPVFVIVGAGYLLQRRLRLDLRPLTDSSLFLFTPALVLASLLRHELATAQFGRFLLFMLAYTAVMAGLAVLLARGCGCAGDTTRALVLSTALMNVGNFGLPLVMFAYGPAALSISVLTFVLFSIALGTLPLSSPRTRPDLLKQPATCCASRSSTPPCWLWPARPSAGSRPSSCCARWSCWAKPPFR